MILLSRCFIMREISNQLIENKIRSLNPHWLGSLHLGLEKRRAFTSFFKLVNNFQLSRSVILMGPRRVGKTVLLHQTIEEFIKKKKNPKKIVYFSLDEPLFYDVSLESLIGFYQKILHIKSLSRCVVIFDEMQYLKGWDVQLKVLVDRYKQTKFVASGSAAGVLKRKSLESGVGRFTDFMLPPLMFCEYLHLLQLTNQLLNIGSKSKRAISAKNIEKLNKEFICYLNYGGFPETIMNKSIRSNPNQFVRQDIIDKVLLKDIPSLYGINDIQELNRLFKYLAYQTVNEISYESFSQASGFAKNTIKKYIEYLEAAFLIKVIYRVNEDGKAFKRANYFKVYLTNPSMYAAMYGLINEQSSDSLGHLVETAIFSQKSHQRLWTDNLYYARLSKNQGEVDMVHLDHSFRISHCLEVKWSDIYYQDPSQLKSLLNFCRKNQPTEVHITTKTKKGKKTYKGLPLQFEQAAITCYNMGL